MVDWYGQGGDTRTSRFGGAAALPESQLPVGWTIAQASGSVSSTPCRGRVGGWWASFVAALVRRVAARSGSLRLRRASGFSLG